MVLRPAIENEHEASVAVPERSYVFTTELVNATLLSAVAGYVDAAGFLALFGLFTAHVTGELVTAAAAVAEGHALRTPRLVMLPIFMGSVASTALVARTHRGQGGASLAPMLGLLTLALALFWAAGVALQPYATTPDGWAVLLIGAAGVSAMGVQNALMRHGLIGCTPTTIMTGNLTQVTMDLVEVLLPDRRRDRCTQAEIRDRLVKFGVPLLAFMVGAAAGGWLTEVFGLVSIALPTLVVGALALLASRAPARAG